MDMAAVLWESIGDFKRFSTYRERVFVSSILLSISIVLEVYVRE
jgi:hypothetical protein